VSRFSKAAASLLAVLAFVFISVADYATAATPTKTASDLLNSIDLAFESSTCTNVKPLLSLYSDNVLVYDVTGQASGKNDYTDFLKKQLCLMDDPSTPHADHRINFDLKEAGGSGNILWASGTYHPSYVNPKGTAISAPDLRFTFIWQKDSNGVYKVVSAHTSGQGLMR